MKFMFVQFHAAPLELLSIALELSKEFNLSIIFSDLKSKKIIDINDDISIYEQGEYLIVFLEKEYSESITSFSALLAAQKKGIYIEAGALSNNELKESIISFSKEDVQYTKNDPKKIIAKFKKFTIAGAIAFNTKEKTEGVSKTHRYTKGAKKLYDSGVKIIPFGGGKTVFFRLP